MEELEQGKMYAVTLTHTFVLPFSHYEEGNGHRVACFETPGVTRFGKQYRKVIEGGHNVHSINKVEPDE